MKGLIFVVLLSVAIFVASASEAPPQPQDRCIPTPCVTPLECLIAGTGCKCSWFHCVDINRAGQMKDVELFEEFIKEYSGNPKMIASAAKALKNKKD